MTLDHFHAPDPPGFKLEPSVIAAFARFARGFWRAETAGVAWALTLGLAACLLLSTAATVALNRWNRWFFDSLAARNGEALGEAVLVFVLIIAAMAAIGVGIVLTRETLQVRWRAWIVKHLVERWLDRQRFYHLNVSGKEPPNPEYRISDDTRWATEPLVDLGIGLLLALVNGAAFIAILWSIGGSLSLELGATGSITVPAYMVILALAYGIIASGLMLWVGAPLVGLVGRKNEAEGYFRFAMMRIRDNAESVATMNGGRYEQAMLQRFYQEVVARWMAMVWQHGRLTWITNASGPMIPIVPLLFAAPKYVSGDLSLGQVTQLAAAFVQVQIAISWLVDNYSRFAEWYASARRVMDIVGACEAIDSDIDRLETAVGEADGAVVLRDFTIADGAGRPLVAGAELVVETGQSVHVCGESSTGKSTLVRVLARLLPCSGRSLAIPRRARVMITPQKSYLPLGSLRGALLYPDPRLAVPAERLRAVLDKVGLAALGSRLDEAARWDQILSNGERQRLAIARLLVHRPPVVIIDDALSALDAAAQQHLLAQLRSELATSTIIYLGQRPAAPGAYDRELALRRGLTGALLLPAGSPTMAAVI
jgi:vitamin B12/bleomycin/antimicrobial peptide transport system ATP-binding/permease protein